MAETSSYSRGAHPSQRRYPPELRERAVPMVQQAIAESGERFGVITKVARQLGIGTESLRSWVRQAEIDQGQRPGTSAQDKERVAAWNGRCGSYAGPMRSCGAPRLSSRPSSTAGVRDDPLHRPAP
jgi:transposase